MEDTRKEVAMLHDLKFNGYRLDQRASRFDAVHANYKRSIAPGYYGLATPGASVTRAFSTPNLYQTSRLGSEYELRPLPVKATTPVRHYLFDGNSKARTGIHVNSDFFYAARSITGRRSLEGLVLCVQYSAPWMRTALAEVGTKEVPGTTANKQILEYFNAAGFSGTDDSGAKNAWCACFVSWVMKQSGYTPPPAHAYRAKEWSKWGRKLNHPVHGAIGIKSRKGGGHVAFVVGKSADGKALFMLGGNQNDRVNIARYDRSVWDTFVVPDTFSNATESLPVYTQPAEISGSEA